MAENEDKVLKAMKNAGKPVRPGDVAEMIDLESKEISKAIQELKKQGKVFSPKRCSGRRRRYTGCAGNAVTSTKERNHRKGTRPAAILTPTTSDRLRNIRKDP